MKRTLLLGGLLLWGLSVWGHGDEKHEPKIVPEVPEAPAEALSQQLEPEQAPVVPVEEEEPAPEAETLPPVEAVPKVAPVLQAPKSSELEDAPEAPSSAVWASLEDFPTLHPLVVHVPVVLLPFAFLLLLLELRRRSEPPQWATTLATLGGTVGALGASFGFHPHVASLSPQAFAVLEAHDLSAYTTTGLAVGASLVLLIRQVQGPTPARPWWTALGLLLLLGASIAVAVTGHLGATLTHLHELQLESSP